MSCSSKIERLRNERAQIDLEINQLLSQQILKCKHCKKGTQKRNLSILKLTTNEDESGYPVHTRTYVQFYRICPKCKKHQKVDSVKDLNLYKEIIYETR